MGEIKSTSFRVNEDDIVKFREITEEQGLNQAEMFESILRTFEMARAKGQITDRAKEVETFQTTVNTLLSMFINSLAINQTSEERIRESLSLELNTKERTIKDLQDQRQVLKDQLSKVTEWSKSIEIQIKEANNELTKLNKELEQKSNIVNSQQEQINTLNSIVTEYKEYKDINIQLEENNAELTKANSELTNVNLNLKSKLENTESMREFYKNEVDNLKEEIKSLNDEVKTLENNHKKEIAKVQHDLEIKHKDELKGMKELYKNDTDNLKAEIKLLNDNHKAFENEHKDELVKVHQELETKYKDELKSVKESYKIESDNFKAEIKSLNDEFKTLENQHKEELTKINQDLEAKYKEELKAKVDFEKEKMLLEQEKANNRADLIQEKYNNLEIQFKEIIDKYNNLEVQFKAVNEKLNKPNKNNKATNQNGAKPKSEGDLNT